jgi:hypothetical protein
MKIRRRRFLHLAVGAAALPAAPRIARAQTYPTRPVRLIVGFPAAGATDLYTRLIGQVLWERLGQQLRTDRERAWSGQDFRVRAPGEFTGGRGPGRASEARSPIKGKDALLQLGGRGGSRHFNANLVITPTPEGAKGSVYLLLFNARNIPATIVETAIYDDTLIKTPQGWRFKKRVVWRDDDDITPFKPKPLPQAQENK